MNHKARLKRLESVQDAIADKYIAGAPTTVLEAIVGGWCPTWQQVADCDYGIGDETNKKTERIKRAGGVGYERDRTSHDRRAAGKAGS